MSDIRPLGSEKLQGMDKIQRILEIAKFKESTPVTENTNSEYKLTLADGNEYQIVKEKVGYVIKKTISESTTDYIEPMKGRKYYSSYSQALKRLNLMAKEMNGLFENKEGISLFSEQKKFVLKNPNAEKKNPEPTSDVENVPAPPPVSPEGGESVPPPPPPPSPEGETTPEMPSGGDMGGDTGEEPPMDEMGIQGPDDMGGDEHEGDVTFKTIQKLTGKLGQKLRTFSSKEDEKMSSKDIKYVINSILSALDLDSLDDDDKEEIMSKFDGEDMSDEDMGGEDMGDDEEPSDEEMGGEDMGNEEEPSDEEMPEGEMTEEGNPWVDFAKTGAMKVMSNMMTPGRIKQQEEGEMVEDENEGHIRRIADEMFVENKVENILTKYFVVNESEKNFNKVLSEDRKKVRIERNKETIKAIHRMSESKKQEMSALKFLKENQDTKFVGRTNKKNLVFETKNKQIKITLEGNII